MNTKYLRTRLEQIGLLEYYRKESKGFSKTNI